MFILQERWPPISRLRGAQGQTIRRRQTWRTLRRNEGKCQVLALLPKGPLQHGMSEEGRNEHKHGKRQEEGLQQIGHSCREEEKEIQEGQRRTLGQLGR